MLTYQMKSDKRKAITMTRSLVQEGDKAPDFKLSDDQGETVQLSRLKGQPVVLFFYPKDNTSGCTAEAKDFSEKMAAFERHNAVVLGISPDSLKSHQKFKEKQDLSVRLLSDEDKTACEAYGVWAEKSMYGRKYMGVERSTFVIDTKGRIAHGWRKVRVPGHVEEVQKTLDLLLQKPKS